MKKNLGPIDFVCVKRAEMKKVEKEKGVWPQSGHSDSVDNI